MRRLLKLGALLALPSFGAAIDVLPRMKVMLDESPVNVGAVGGTMDRFYGDAERLLKVLAPGTTIDPKGNRLRILKGGKVWIEIPRDAPGPVSTEALIYSPPGAITPAKARYDDLAMEDRDLGTAVNIDYFAALFDVTVDVQGETIQLYTPKFWLKRLGVDEAWVGSYQNAPNLVEDFGITPPAKTLRLWVRPTRAAFVQIYRVAGGELPRPMFGVDVVTGQPKQFTMGDVPAPVKASPTDEARAETTFFDKAVGSVGLYAAVVSTRSVPDPRKAILDGTLKPGEFAVVGLRQTVAEVPLSFGEAKVNAGETWLKLEERLKTSAELLRAINGYLSAEAPKAGAKLTFIEGSREVADSGSTYTELGWYGVQTRDTLAKLAADWVVKESDILAANPSLNGGEPNPGDLIVRIAPKVPVNPVNPPQPGRFIDQIMRLARTARPLTEARLDGPAGNPLPEGTKVNALQEVEPGLIQALVGDEEVYFRKDDLILPSRPETPEPSQPMPSSPEPVPIAPAQLGTLSGSRALVHNAFRFIGTPYRWGGSSLRGGIDCSHFVQEIFRYTKFAKPPSAPVISQEQVGQVVHRKPGSATIWRGMRSYNASNVPDKLTALRIGDRFIHQKTPGKAISGHRHTGIYVGRVRYRGRVYNNAVVHSAGSKGITVDEITGGLWKSYRYSVRDVKVATPRTR